MPLPSSSYPRRPSRRRFDTLRRRTQRRVELVPGSQFSAGSRPGSGGCDRRRDRRRCPCGAIFRRRRRLGRTGHACRRAGVASARRCAGARRAGYSGAGPSTRPRRPRKRPADALGEADADASRRSSDPEPAPAAEPAPEPAPAADPPPAETELGDGDPAPPPPPAEAAPAGPASPTPVAPAEDPAPADPIAADPAVLSLTSARPRRSSLYSEEPASMR